MSEEALNEVNMLYWGKNSSPCFWKARRHYCRHIPSLQLPMQWPSFVWYSGLPIHTAAIRTQVDSTMFMK